MLKKIFFSSFLSLHFCFFPADDTQSRHARPAHIETHFSMPAKKTPFNPIALSHDGTAIITSITKPIPSDSVVKKHQRKVHIIFLKDILDETIQIKFLQQLQEKPLALAYKDGAIYAMASNGDISRHAENPQLAFFPDFVGTHPGIDATKKCGLRIEEQKLVSYGHGTRCAWDLSWEPDAQVSACAPDLHHQSDTINEADIQVRQYRRGNDRNYSLLVRRFAPHLVPAAQDAEQKD
jgi:hypothetical protein